MDATRECDGMQKKQAFSQTHGELPYAYQKSISKSPAAPVRTWLGMEVEEGFFNEPSDVTDISMIETIRTAPFNLEGEQWGVAVMVLQANLPQTLPGQNVTFILMGDTELENAVAPEDAYDPITGIDVAQLDCQ